MKRLIWIGIGVGLTVVVMRRGRATAQRFVPANVLAQGEELASRTWHGAQEFIRDAKNFAAQREDELRSAFTDAPDSD